MCIGAVLTSWQQQLYSTQSLLCSVRAVITLFLELRTEKKRDAAFVSRPRFSRRKFLGSALQHSELCRGALIVGSGDVKHLPAGRRQDGGDFRRQRGRNGHTRTGSESEEQNKETMHGANSIEGGGGDAVSEEAGQSSLTSG